MLNESSGREAPVLVATVFAAFVLSCAGTSGGGGPPPPDVVEVVTDSTRSKITHVDGRESKRREVELSPGDHALEFSWGSRAKLIGSLPLVSTQCQVEFELRGGERYVFEPHLEKERLERLPSHDRSWTRYRLDPVLRIESNGDAVPGLTCAPLCRVVSVNGSKKQTSACDSVEGAGVDETAPLRHGPAGADDELALEALRQANSICDPPRGESMLECLGRSMAYIPFQLGAGEVVVFVPQQGVRLPPGAKRRAQEECTSDLAIDALVECLGGHGWERVHAP